jgi:hypothetical protein
VSAAALPGPAGARPAPAIAGGAPALAMAIGIATFVAASHLEAGVAAVAHNPAIGGIAVTIAGGAGAWAARAFRRPSRATLLAGAAAALALVALWVWTRAVDVPLDGSRGRAPVGVLDALTAFDELLLAWFALSAARSRGRSGSDRWPVLGCLAISLSFIALAMGCAPSRSPAAGSGGTNATGVALICHLY